MRVIKAVMIGSSGTGKVRSESLTRGEVGTHSLMMNLIQIGIDESERPGTCFLFHWKYIWN